MQYGANAPQALSCAICRTKDTKDSAHTVLFASALPLCVCRCSFRSCHPKTSMLRFGVQLAIEGGLGLRGVAAPLLSLSQHWAGVAVQPVVQLHTSVPALAQTSQGPERQTKQPQAMSDHQKALQADPALRRKALVNSLLYRSRQRGFLEMDLLVGIWAEKQVPNLGEDMLVQFSQVLDQENPDLYKWLTGQEQPPAAMAGNAAYQALHTDVAIQLKEHIDQSSRASQGKEWVRGWDDWNKASEIPVAPGPEIAKQGLK